MNKFMDKFINEFKKEVSTRLGFLIIALAIAIFFGGAFTTSSLLLAVNEQVLNVPVMVVSVPATKSVADTTGNQKTLVLLIKYLDSGPDPLSLAEAKDRIFNGPFQEFYNEQSYGKITFSGDVYGWYTVPKNMPVSALDLYSDNDNIDISSTIRGENINVALYDRLVIVVNAPFMTGVSTRGKNTQTINGVPYNISKTIVYVTTGNINSPEAITGSFIHWTHFDYSLSHEMGHALGLPHAQGWNCGNTIFSNPCVTMEYGNPFDIIGGSNALHFNAYYKELLGWVAPISELVITKSGRYTINPIETGLGIKLAKIKLTDGTTPFYLEYRKAIGFDSALNNAQVRSNQDGLLINYISFDNWSWLITTAHLLDMSPSDHTNAALPTSPCTVNTNTSPASLDMLSCWGSGTLAASLNGTNTFSVLEDGLTIGPIISTTANSITFNVTLATSAQPSITVISPNGGETWTQGTKHNITWRATGATNVAIFAVAVNADPSRATRYTIASSVPASSGSYSWNIGIGTTMPAGQYKIEIRDFNNVANADDYSDNYFSIASAPVNRAPVGYLDAITNGVVTGWAVDPDVPSAPISVDLYIDATATSFGTYLGRVTANVASPDITAVFPTYTGNHRFAFAIPAQYRDGRQHAIYAHGIDSASSGGTKVLLTGSPKTFTLAR